jgi:F0F1-type ATP synthase membrane subunit b/b'
MINTPEFWIAVSFVICCGISYKKILPKLVDALNARRAEIESLFSDAETILKAAEKKFSRTQERLDALPELFVEMEKEFDSQINHLLAEWAIQKERLTKQYRHLGEQKLHQITDHVRSQLYQQIIDAAIKVLNGYFSNHIDAKTHQRLVFNTLTLVKDL